MDSCNLVQGVQVMDIEALLLVVSQQIYTRRAQMNMSLKQLGDLIGTSPIHVWRWEQRKHLPSSWFLCQLADVFECTVDELLGRGG